MGAMSRTPRVAGRLIGATAVARFTKRYPLVAVLLFVWKWWRRRTAHTDHQVIRLKAGQTITVSDRNPGQSGGI